MVRITFYSEDTPQGETAEWPLVPREGEFIEYNHKGGTSALKVESVVWHANTDSSFHSVSLHLTY